MQKVNITVTTRVRVFPKTLKYNVLSQDVTGQFTNRDGTVDAMAILFNRIESLHDRICKDCHLSLNAI